MRPMHEAYKAEEVRHLEYACPDASCGFVNTVAVAPFHPVISKHRCSHCNRLNDVKTRESFVDIAANHAAEAREITAHDLRKPRSVQINSELTAVREARERALGKRTVVKTVWGNAGLVG